MHYFQVLNQPCPRDQCGCPLRGLLPLPWNSQCCRQPGLETGLSGPLVRFKVAIHISFIFGVHINITPIQISCVSPPALWGPAVLSWSTSCQCTQGMAESWKFNSCLYEFKQLTVLWKEEMPFTLLPAFPVQTCQKSYCFRWQTSLQHSCTWKKKYHRCTLCLAASAGRNERHKLWK